jgi:hypothetical protein
MKKRSPITIAALLTVLCYATTESAFGRGGRGGGGGARMGGGGFSGGGMARPGGGFSGGMARPMPSPSINRSPSLSRAAPSVSRPSMPSNFGGSRPASSLGSGSLSTGSLGSRPFGPSSGGIGSGSHTAARPTLPSGGASQLPQFGGGAAGNRPATFDRPTQGQVSNFLNMPGGSNAARPGADGGGINHTTTGPGGNTIYRGDHGTVIKGDSGAVAIGGGTVTGPGGTTIGGAGAIGVKEGPAGGTHVAGKGVAGATNNGNTAVAGGSFSGSKGPGGATAGQGSGFIAGSGSQGAGIAAGSASGVRGPGGAAAGSVSGIGAINTGGDTRVAGGAAAGVRGPAGGAAGTAGGFRGSVDGGGFTGQAGAGSGIRGPAGNTWTNAGRASIVNGQIVAGARWGTVNGNFTHWGAFGPGWIAGYPGAWWPGKWAWGLTAWATTGWAVAGDYCGCYGEPMYYDYGEDVTYQDDTVYYGDQPVAAADQYYHQAMILAMRGLQPSASQDWLPLGVFGLVAEGQSQAEKVLQLAVNKDGILRGNLYDALSDTNTPVFGAVDKPTQRVALMMQGNDSVVLETGLYNLTNDESTALVHFDAVRRENRTLVRLQQPAEGQAAPATQAPSSAAQSF